MVLAYLIPPSTSTLSGQWRQFCLPRVPSYGTHWYIFAWTNRWNVNQIYQMKHIIITYHCVVEPLYLSFLGQINQNLALKITLSNSASQYHLSYSFPQFQLGFLSSVPVMMKPLRQFGISVWTSFSFNRKLIIKFFLQQIVDNQVSFLQNDVQQVISNRCPSEV